jgi:hypothetical protein
MMTNDIDIVVTEVGPNKACARSNYRAAPEFSSAIDICKICERKACPGTGVVAHQHARLLCSAALCEHCAMPMVQVNERADRKAMPWHMKWSDPCAAGTYELAEAQGVKLCRRCLSTQMVGIAVGTLIKYFMKQQSLKRCVSCCRAHFSMEYSEIVPLNKDSYPKRLDRDSDHQEILYRKCCSPCVDFLLTDVQDESFRASRFEPTRRNVCWVMCST